MGDSLRPLSDQELKARLLNVVRQERENSADVIELLMELDRRGKVMEWGYPSLYAYCTEALGYGEYGAFTRIAAARAATKYPDVLDRLRAGKIHLEAIAILVPALTAENSVELLEKADGASKREVQSLVANLLPETPPQRDVVRSVAPSKKAEDPEIVKPAPFRFSFTAESDLLTLVERLKGFLWNKFPDGRLEDIFSFACRETLERLEREHRPNGRAKRQTVARKKSRRVPRPIRRLVWERDGGKCAYVSPEGRRCESCQSLEFDHITPWAHGGRSDTAENIRLLCRAHNQWLGRKEFGPRN